MMTGTGSFFFNCFEGNEFYLFFRQGDFLNTEFLAIFDMIFEQVLSNEVVETVVTVISHTIVTSSIAKQPRYITNQSIVRLTRFVVDNEK